MQDETGENGRLVAVVATHRRLADLRQTLAALLAAPARDLAAVLVVDNASDDGTGAWLAAQREPRLHVLTLPRNLGCRGTWAAPAGSRPGCGRRWRRCRPTGC